MPTVSGVVPRLACIALVTLSASTLQSVPSLRAQSIAPASATTGAALRTSAPVTVAKVEAPVPKSLPQRVLDTPWVVFPMRLAIVIVLLAVSLLFLIGGCWGAMRMAHVLRHMRWKEPPRRIKRGELGAAGASLAFEFEERLNAKREEDDERDRQIAILRQSVEHLAQMQIELMGTMAKPLKASKRR